MLLQVRAQAQQAITQIDATTASISRMRAAAAAAHTAFASMNGGLPLLSKWGNQLQWAGRQLQYNFTMPLLLAGLASTKFALDNEKAMVRVIKVYGDGSAAMNRLSKTEIPALERAFTALSNTYGVVQSQVIEIAGDWAAAGASGLALAKSVEATLQTMILGEMEAAEATEALIAIQAQYGLSTKELTETISVLNIVENQTGISMQGLVQGFSRAAGVARSAGIDVEHLAAMMAALVPAAGTAANAGNALKTMISRLLSPTGEATDILKRMNIESESLAWHSLNGAQRLELLATKFQKLDDSTKAVVSSTIASRWQINRFDVLMRDIANPLGYYAKALKASADATVNFNQRQKELNAVLSSNPRQLKIMWTILQNALAEVIKPLLPALVAIAASVAQVANNFANMDPAQQKFILAMLGILALIGPVLKYLGSFAVLIGILGFTFYKVFGAMSTVLKTVGKDFAKVFLKIGGWVSKFVSAFAALNSLIIPVIVSLAAAIGTTLKGAMIGAAGAMVAFRVLMTKITLVFGLVQIAMTRAFMVGMAAMQLFLFTTMPAMFAAARTVMLGASVALWGVLQTAWMMTVPAMMASMSAVMTRISILFSTGAAAAGAAASRAWALMGLAFAQVMWAMRVAFFGLQAFLVTGFAKLGAAITGIWRVTAAAIGAIWASLPALMSSVGAVMVSIARVVGAAIVFAFTNAWALAGVIILAAIGVFWDQIVAFSKSAVQAVGNVFNEIAPLFMPVVAFFDRAVGWITDAFWSLPKGVRDAMLGVLRVVQNFALQIYEWMSYLNPFVRHSPSLVESVTAGMDEIASQYGRIKNVGQVFANAARDLKTFKDATAGMGGGEFGADRKAVAEQNPAALGAFDALAANLGPLNALLAEMSNLIIAQEREVKRWEDALASADAAIDQQEMKLDGLKNTLDALTDAYETHKNKMEEYANAPIQGMRAMSDQIFNNEMAQKRLRLEILRMEDAGGSIEDLRNRLAAMSGDLEVMRGTASELRQAGAGSDILGPITAEIEAMEAQYAAVQAQVNNSPVNQLQQQLDALQRQGEILDLENALAFDPLTRQIEQASNAMQELPFDTIIAGIASERAAMDALKPSIDAATAAVNSQQVVLDNMKLARDALAATYDTEKGKLDELNAAYGRTEDAIREIESALQQVGQAASDANRALGKNGGQEYISPAAANFDASIGGDFADVGGNSRIDREGGLEDQSKLIDDFTAGLATDTGNMLLGFDMFGPIKEKWNEFTGWWDTNVTPAWSDLTGGISSAFGTVDVGGAFTEVQTFFGDFMEGVREFIGNLETWGDNIAKLFKPIFEEIIDKLWPALKDAWEDIKGSFEGFSEMGGPIVDALSNLWTIIKPILAVIGAALVGVFTVAFNILAEILPPIIKFIGDVISGVVEIIKGIINVIVGIFTLDGDRIMQGLIGIFAGVGEILWGILDGAFSLVWGLVKGLVEGIVDFFVWLWDVLVGHSIIPDMVNAIVQWFADMWTWVVELVSGLVNGVINWFQDLWDGAVEKVTGVYNAMLFWWGYIKNAVMDFVMKMALGVIGWFLQLKADLDAKMALIKALVSLAWEWIKTNTIEKLRTLVTDAVAKFVEIKTKVESNIDLLKTAISTKFDAVKTTILGAFEFVRDRITGIFDTIVSKIKSGINSAIKAINKLIDGLNKIADVLPGLDWSIGAIPLLAGGGGIPSRRVGSGFRTSGARAIVGEGKANHPEYVIPTDPTYRNRARELYASLGNQLGVPQLAKGGILGAIGSAIGSVKSGIKNGIDWATDAAAGVATKFLDPFMKIAQEKINNISWKQGKEAAQAGFNQVTSWRTDANKAYKAKAESMGGPMAGGSFGRPAGNWPGPTSGGLASNAANAAAFARGKWAGIASVGGFAARNIAGTGVRSDHSRGKATDFMLDDYRSAAARATGKSISEWFAANPGAYGTKYIIYYDQINTGSGWRAYKHPGGGGDTLQHRDHVHVSYLANGGVVRASRNGSLAVLGEGGQDEAVVPLPADWKAIFAVLRGVDPYTLKRAGAVRATAAMRAAGAGRVGGSAQQPTVVHNEFHFHGDLSFPNISNGDDAEDFVDNLKNLAG